ncbi:MAG: TIGR00153 family protein [Halioglobus sp.]|nr:TIGR00153 family protein [Halioglobus sp.]
MVSTNPLGNLFGRSPIRPIQEHMQIANEAAQQLPGLFQAAAEGDWAGVKQAHKAIVDAERRADKVKRSIRRRMPKSLFLPVPRADLLSLVGIQDKVANTARDVSSLVLGREMQFPEQLSGVFEYVEACCLTANLALGAIQELDELLEVGFSGREVKRVEGMLKALAKQERRTDKQSFALRGRLFKLESELPPVDVMFYYKVLSLVGRVADEAEKVGDRLQILLAK